MIACLKNGYRAHANVFFRLVALSLFVICFTTTSRAQYFELDDNLWQSNFPFKIVRNMVIVKVKINGRGPFNFVLDSGSGLIAITDPKLADSLKIKDRRTIKLTGHGDGEELEAFVSSNIKMELPGIRSVNIGAAFFKKDHFGLTAHAGIPITGLIGYEFFNKLVVKVDFNDSTITAYNPKDFRASKRYEKIPLVIEDNKSYINAKLNFFDKSSRDCKLVVDLGAGHALSLEDANTKKWPTEKAIAANLGVGLTGPISGEIGRVSGVSIGKFSIGNVLSSFPENMKRTDALKNRDGNLGLNILKKFVVIFDYPGGNLYLRSRGYVLKEPFEHDMSGLEYFAGGNRLRQVFISRVEPGSPGDDIGLLEDDELVKINFKPVYEMTLEQLDSMFKSGEGKSFLLEVMRKEKKEKLILTLRKRI